MNDKFEEWFDKAIDEGVFELTAPSAQHKAALAAWEECEKQMKQIRHGCHLAAHRGKIFVYAFCMHDDGQDCMWGKSKDGCPYWKPIED